MLAKDDRLWRIGTDADVDWIRTGTGVSSAITAAIPAVFEAYGTFAVPDPDGDRDLHDQALLTLLTGQSGEQPWLLGYLDTGADEPISDKAPLVTLYTGWRYLIVEAGPEQAASWRTNSIRAWRGALPDLMFPLDRSWLVSWLWDDDWRCVGGPGQLVESICRDPQLQGRSVNLGEDATPPGHTMR
jgi:hypothetical protein